MLQKNVYILYPAGYGGSFINWAINASDCDLSVNTVTNPVNKTTSTEFGGSGTSHNHVRIPTHQSLENHMAWVYLNKPDYKHVYIINTTESELNNSIVQLLQADRDGVFISIHHNNDTEQKAFGIINGVIKWPSYFETNTKISKKNPVYDGFDIFNCANDRQFRNFVTTEFNQSFPFNKPIDFDSLDSRVENRQVWYNTRHQLQPHEVNSNTYVDRLDYSNRIFEISLRDLFSDRFVFWFKEFMQSSKVSTEYNTEKVEQVHPEYLSAQTTLPWFNTIKQYDQTKIIDPFLTSHSVIEGCFLHRLFGPTNIEYLENYQKYQFLKGGGWPAQIYNWGADDLSNVIKFEMLALGYIPKRIEQPASVIELHTWQNMNLVDIVKHF